jgi:hypothetical protein
MNRFSYVAALAVLLVLPACSDSTGSDADLHGTLQFSYVGAFEGEFRAENRTALPLGDEAAIALESDGPAADPGILVMALDARAGSEEGDMLMLELPLLNGPRSLPVDEFCQDDSCAGGVLLMDTGADDGSGFFSLVSGTVQVTEISGNRIRGSFSGTARDEFSEAELTIAGGTFDVPMSDGDRALQTRARYDVLLNR